MHSWWSQIMLTWEFLVLLFKELNKGKSTYIYLYSYLYLFIFYNKQKLDFVTVVLSSLYFSIFLTKGSLNLWGKKRKKQPPTPQKTIWEIILCLLCQSSHNGFLLQTNTNEDSKIIQIFILDGFLFNISFSLCSLFFSV